ncbi:SurA N-terminal domain-containing protein [Pseudomonas lini]
MQRRQLMQQLGKDFDASLLDEKNASRIGPQRPDRSQTAAARRRKKSKFAFSEAALDQVILQTPEFQVDGKFNAERFDQVIRQLGYSRLQFRQMLAQEMLIGQLRAGLAGSGFVTDAQVLAFARLEKNRPAISPP